MYSGYGITFDSAHSWSFYNDFSRNVMIYGVDKSSSSHTDNRKNNFVLPCEGLTFGINGSVGLPQNKVCINFSNTKTKYFWVCIIMLIIVICLLMKKKYLRLKPTKKCQLFNSILSRKYI